MPNHQYSLALINHQVENSIIDQRSADGYINATAMCKAAGKLFGHYKELGSTTAFLAALSSDIAIPISELVQVIKGGEPHLQGTWVHPQVALNLAQWLSPTFAVQVTKWVYEWMSGKSHPTKLPYHLERHMMNMHKIPVGHFSVLQEMTNAMIAPMEARGYTLPENLVPDISHGRMLCKHLRDTIGMDTNALPTYEHTFPNGRVVDAKLYPVEHLGTFRKLLDEYWLPQKAAAYFKDRDPKALPVIDNMLMLGRPKEPTGLPPANKPKFRKKA